MRNLAGKESEASTACGQELREAGIPYAVVDPDGEVGSKLGGVIKVGGYEIQLVRRWVYWSARITKTPQVDGWKLPRDLARALNDAPYKGPLGYYCGGAPRLGSVVRANGYAGGLDSADVDNVGCWHIDTQEGLRAFAQWCGKNLGGSTQ